MASKEINKGNLVIRRFESDSRKHVTITPKGFWTDIITVSTDTDWTTNEWETPRLSRSSGGSDGTLSATEEIDMVIEGLNFAKEIIAEWSK